MTKIDYYSCEPFRAWNRLEPRPRKSEFDKVLEAGVHDALWMMTRQWQFGELQGEDTGSAIFAKIRMQTTAITRLKKGAGEVQNYSDTMPLEKGIESMGFQPDHKTRLEAAFMFLQLLDMTAKKLSVAGFVRSDYKSKLRALFPLTEPAKIDAADQPDIILSKAELLSHEAVVEVAATSARKYFDGFILFQNLVANQSGTIDKIVLTAPNHKAFVTSVSQQFIYWFNKNYGDKIGATNQSWIPQQLEYQFACSVPEKDQTNTVLSADEYYTGTLDWYAFDVNKNGTVNGLSGIATPAEMNNIKENLVTVIPTQARFAGAPNSRWWQFENGDIDLGNINAETTDIAKLIFTEYALLYNTDWFVVPYTVPVGTLSTIKGIVVKDVFGEQSFVQSAVQGETDDWSGWGMFNLSAKRPDGVRNLPVDTRLLIPPATVKTMESEPIEEVHFVRDEISNNVWAIEAKLADGLGGSIDGYNIARSFEELLELYDDAEVNDPEAQEAVFKYVLSNTVPENWIPFLPVHVKNNSRAIQLQRASMPRLFKKKFSPIRPRTQFLRQNLDASNVQIKPYYINEEEVPRAGIRLKSGFQRTRWYNGAVVDWYGYRKTVGRGEGSSGLAYDLVEPVVKA